RLIVKNYKLWTYDDASQVLKDITIATDSYPYTVQFNIVKNSKIIDNKLYLYSQSNNSLYRFDNFSSQPLVVLTNYGSTFYPSYSSLEKCGNSIYLAVGSSENNFNSLWSFDPQSNISNLIYTTNYSGLNKAKNLTCLNNYMYYSKENSNSIYRTNGTQQSVVTMDTTIDNAEQLEPTDSIDDIFSYDGHLYFVATTKESGKELFHIKTDLPTFLMTDDIHNVKKSNITIAPNPTSGFVKIFAESNINKVEVYNSSGAKISETQSDRLDFSKLNSGVYLVKIYTDDFIETKKIIKK
ncbi:MAG: T9SS type A sorting domain-containing protein, partial [Weeksellaceae bacterium]|nr:T9SS type A sorting domain-containing protein [Weeksellaceae bacterium]